MGIVHATDHVSSQAPPPPPPANAGSESGDNKGQTSADVENLMGSAATESGPGTFEDLHKKCKDVFPQPFEGAKLLINKGLSNHFQIAHTMTMSSLSPSGYRFGCTYVGTNQFSPTESYPILVGDIDPAMNLNAQIIHKFSEKVLTKMVAQIQNQKWVNQQFTSEYHGTNSHAALTLGNIDIVGKSGVVVAQYLQNLTKRLALGSEFLYQYGPAVPGGEIGIFTLATKYTTDKWCFSGSLTPLAGGVHLCYFHKASDALSFGAELDGSLRTQECTATLGYQLDMPAAQINFRGQIDSNWCVGAVLEKKLQPLPFTFSLSGFANHVKGAYRFGIGLFVG